MEPCFKSNLHNGDFCSVDTAAHFRLRENCQCAITHVRGCGKYAMGEKEVKIRRRFYLHKFLSETAAICYMFKLFFSFFVFLEIIFATELC